MPCPKCNAPDIQNVQVNYCYYCGFIFNPAIQKEKEKPDKALNVFAIIFGGNILAAIVYMILPYVVNLMYSGTGSPSFIVAFKFTSVFFGIVNVTLLFFASSFLKQKNLKILFLIYSILNLILMTLNVISWIWQARHGIF